MLNTLRSTAKNTIIYSFGTFASRLVGFILIPLYTEKLTVGEYGMLGMLDISWQILVSIVGLGLFNAYFRWYWSDEAKGKTKSLLFTILATVICVALTLGFFGFIFAPQLSGLILESSKYAYLIQLLFVAVLLEAIIVVYSVVFRIKDKAVLFSVLMLVKLLVSLSLNVYLIVYQGKSVEAIYIAQIIGSIVYLVVGSYYIRKDIEFRFNLPLLKTILSYSLPLTVVALAGIVLNTTDRYVLKILSGLDEVGKYSLGFKISNTIRVFLITSVNLALQPVIFKMIDKPNSKRFYSKIMTYFSFGLILFVMFFSFFGKEIVKVLSKSSVTYWDAYKVIPIISLGLFFSMLRDVSLTGINISKKTSLTARIIITSMLVNIVLCFFLTHFFSFIGAAIAASASQFLFFVLVYRTSQRIYPIPYEIKKVTLLVALALAMYVGVLFIDRYGLLTRFIVKSALIISFPFILYPLKFYEDIEIERIKQFFAKWSKLSKLKENIRSIGNIE